MKKMNIVAALVFMSASVFAQTWTVDKSHAKLGFQITHLMISDVDGSFKSYSASLTSSKDDFSDAVFEISADIDSIDTGHKGRDKDLRSEGYFDAAKFPKFTFKSTSITKGEGNKYKLAGDLTMKGVTKSVGMDVVINGPIDRRGKKVIGLKVTGTIKRVDFGVGKPGGAMLSEEVQIMANGEFVKG